jgi:hypothetical protein
LRSRDEFVTPRAIDLKIYLVESSRAIGFRTSLLILGMALLQFALDHLGMEELRIWRNVESGLGQGWEELFEGSAIVVGDGL